MILEIEQSVISPPDTIPQIAQGDWIRLYYSGIANGLTDDNARRQANKKISLSQKVVIFERAEAIG